jgi:subtilisin-like proprotein convertase family protein
VKSTIVKVALLAFAAAALAIGAFATGGTASANAPEKGVCDPATPVPIPDLSTATVECTVTQPGFIKDLNVGVVLSHTFIPDLNIHVEHVDTGTSVLLMPTFTDCFDGIDAVFDDESANPVATTCPLTGDLRPAGSLSAFDGETFAGTWRLTVNDKVGIDVGEITGFRLFVDTNTNITKSPALQNLWLCNQLNGAGAAGLPPSSVCNDGEVSIDLGGRISGRDPKCTGFPNFLPPEECDFQTIGSFEFEVRYDSKYLNLEVEPGSIWPRDKSGELISEIECAETRTENSIWFRCNVKGKGVEITGPGGLAVIHARPTADDFSILIASQLNGIVTQLINQDCQLADLQGHPIEVTGEVCNDGAITIRYLEGDHHADCTVDVRDQQQIAFRWGASEGQLLYNSRFDIEPSYPKLGDGDIDGKDIQMTYGRHGSTCVEPHPEQPPIDPKSKENDPPAPPEP